MCIFGISLNLIIQKNIQDFENKKANNNLVKIITNYEEKNSDLSENINKKNEIENNIKQEENSKEEVKKSAKNKINWDLLHSINKDIVGWIEVPNTNINYPILKDKDLYYLNHTFERKYNPNGSIFLNNQDFLKEKEICIYGHNMKNGTMFANLAKYMNKEFFEKNSKIYIYTKESTFEGEIFAIYSKTEEEENNEIKNLKNLEKLDYYKNQSINYKRIEEKYEKIIKLITCSYINAETNPTNQRYYVIAQMKRIS